MKTSLRIIILLTGIVLVTASCSRKKDTFLNRNYHALSARDNTLFNGYNALNQGVVNLKASYQDNYWDILPIERMEIFEEITLPGQSKNESFSRAEEKAIKAVQKHGMNIDGKERNPQIDEAYLLLGKARYFDQRFIPALEAFNYILYKYPASDKINQAKIWREKTNIRLENDELAIKNLKRLLEQEELEKQDLADATSMLAQAYINTKSLDSALTQIDIAASSTKNNDERGRYRFIQGQLYNALGDKDSANIAFDRVIELNRRIPRIYLITAHLEKAKNFNYDKGNKLEFLELLTDLEENRENRPFLDKIYFQIAQYHLQNQSDSLAVAYYNKSLRTNTQDQLLRAKNYETIGNINFDNSEYKLAGAYYDSTMKNLKTNSKPYRIIKRKRDNLEDVINYEDIAKVDDSILDLVAMSNEARLTYFQGYTEKLKQLAEEEKERQEQAARSQKPANTNDKLTAQMSRVAARSKGPMPGVAATFYFYNPTTVAYGKTEFVSNWGNRSNADNWRWSSKAKSALNTELAGLLDDEASNEIFDPKFYIDQIPTEDKAIDSITKERNYAYYQLGLIYKEKFKEYELSKDKFQTLLSFSPEEKLILPSKYNLYKIYTLLGENDEATISKNDIISNYPESRYAAILKNPESANLKDESSPESIYENLYRKLQDQQYAEVIVGTEEYITLFEGDPIVPKLELLKAQASGRLHGYEAYSKGMNFIALNYANTPEGQQAKNIVDNVLPKISNKKFTDNPKEKNFKIVYTFSKDEFESIEDFKKQLKEAIEKVRVFDMSLSTDVYNEAKKFVVIHGLKSKEGAEGYASSLLERKKNKITKPFFAVSSSNYRVIQIHKNVDEYTASNQ
ncbi:tetratricopeptide repeat protein [Corallibacter sp.]|uniref:type IX secretion system periplasmic lipoprotein PorW/SprE n=1 Tax=Corallibacter sp. TaxID=2038084 RepID=UPI003A91DA88